MAQTSMEPCTYRWSKNTKILSTYFVNDPYWCKSSRKHEWLLFIVAISLYVFSTLVLTHKKYLFSLKFQPTLNELKFPDHLLKSLHMTSLWHHKPREYLNSRYFEVYRPITPPPFSCWYILHLVKTCSGFDRVRHNSKDYYL